MRVFICVALLLPLLTASLKVDICQPNQQIRVNKTNTTMLANGELWAHNKGRYPNGTYWAAENNQFVLCPCKIGRCVAKCSNLFQEDGQKYQIERPLDFKFKIQNDKGEIEKVVFNEHFHVFDEARKSVPYYFLFFSAFLEPKKLDQNEPFPIVWNATMVNKVCFIVDHQQVMFLEAPVENYREVAQLFVIWSLNAFFLTFLVIALHKAGDNRTIYGKCLIRHAISMMLANLGIFLCTQLYLLGTVLPSWLCYTLGFLTYYFEMCLLFWLTSLLHIICVTFNSIQSDNVKAPTARRFRVYALISWIVPMILTILLYVTVFHILKTYSLHGGILFSQFDKFMYRYNCFIARWESTYFLFKLLPEIIFVILNVYFFGKTAINIYKTQSEVQLVLKTKTTGQIQCYSFLVFLKLFSLMGMTRIIEILCWFVFYQQRNLFLMILQAVGAMQALWLVIFCVITKEKVREVFKGWFKQTQNFFFCKKVVEVRMENSVSFKTSSTNAIDSPGKTHSVKLAPSK